MMSTVIVLLVIVTARSTFRKLVADETYTLQPGTWYAHWAVLNDALILLHIQEHINPLLTKIHSTRSPMSMSPKKIGIHKQISLQLHENDLQPICIHCTGCGYWA